MRLTKILLLLLLTSSIKAQNANQIDPWEKKNWILSWRVYQSFVLGDLALAERQFDSLRNITLNIEPKIIQTGIQLYEKIGKQDKASELFQSLDFQKRVYVCENLKHVKNSEIMSFCDSLPKHEVKNPKLKIELIKMFVRDQAVRDNLLEDTIEEYKFDRSEFLNNDPIEVDRQNLLRLKNIITEWGFPSKEDVGLEAMNAIFILIQHSDSDMSWQKLQLENIKQAALRGDIEKQSYAYLYDRIKVNEGEKQMFGTQISNVDHDRQEVEFAEIDDPDNVDLRRKEFGIMPMEIYKNIVISKLQQSYEDK